MINFFHSTSKRLSIIWCPAQGSETCAVVDKLLIKILNNEYQLLKIFVFEISGVFLRTDSA